MWDMMRILVAPDEERRIQRMSVGVALQSTDRLKCHCTPLCRLSVKTLYAYYSSTTLKLSRCQSLLPLQQLLKTPRAGPQPRTLRPLFLLRARARQLCGHKQPPALLAQGIKPTGLRKTWTREHDGAWEALSVKRASSGATSDLCHDPA